MGFGWIIGLLLILGTVIWLILRSVNTGSGESLAGQKPALNILGRTICKRRGRQNRASRTKRESDVER